jgi:UDP-N-acetylglucosamine--N-acetylmuramyl-(pentapeptide) pyrophosphoryl-undecaprenol N-acetylglucosamine transferase
MVASGGGHLDLLREIAPALGDRERCWVTTSGRGIGVLRSRGERAFVLPSFDRRRPDPAHLARSVALAARERPQLVVTSGAGVAVSFCTAARALGARLLFVETMARVGELSASGRVLARLAHRTLVQWPETATVVPGVVSCRPALLEGVGHAAMSRGKGTFVALGTHHQPFRRLMSIVTRAIAEGLLPRPVVVQAGATSDHTPDGGAEVHRWLTAEAMRATLAESAVVVCHAGAGIAAAALRAGRRPILVPRTQADGEHVDDHQAQIAHALQARGLAVRVNGRITARDVACARAPIEPPHWADGVPRVVDEVADFIHEAERRRMPARARTGRSQAS